MGNKQSGLPSETAMRQVDDLKRQEDFRSFLREIMGADERQEKRLLRMYEEYNAPDIRKILGIANWAFKGAEEASIIHRNLRAGTDQKTNAEIAEHCRWLDVPANQVKRIAIDTSPQGQIIYKFYANQKDGKPFAASIMKERKGGRGRGVFWETVNLRKYEDAEHALVFSKDESGSASEKKHNYAGDNTRSVVIHFHNKGTQPDYPRTDSLSINENGLRRSIAVTGTDSASYNPGNLGDIRPSAAAPRKSEMRSARPGSSGLVN